jgi:hypothetical protein
MPKVLHKYRDKATADAVLYFFYLGSFILPKVLHKYKDSISNDAAIVHRPSKWGNPFVIGRDGTREEVIAKFRAWIVTQAHLMEALGELRGRDLICFCAPQECHGDVLLELANQ